MMIYLKNKHKKGFLGSSYNYTGSTYEYTVYLGFNALVSHDKLPEVKIDVSNVILVNFFDNCVHLFFEKF